MADFRGEKTVEINIRTRIGQASGVKGPSSRPGVVRIEVPESFRFLSGVELDQSDVEQLRKLPPSQRGQAIYGSKFLKNKQSGPESLRSSALDIQTLMNRQGGLTVREMLENFNRYNIARNNPSLANKVKMYDSPSSQSHIQSNQMLKEGFGQIAGAALAFPALRGASLAIGALPQVPRMMATIGLGYSWLSSAREGRGPLTIPNWLMGNRVDATGGSAGLAKGFEVASEAMMLGDLAKGIGSIFRGFGFGRVQAQQPGTAIAPSQSPGGGGPSGANRPKLNDPNVIDAEWSYVDRVNSGPSQPVSNIPNPPAPPNMPSPRPPGPPMDRSRKKFFNLLQSMRKPSEDLGVFGKSRKIYEKFQNATSDTERDLIRREFVDHLNMLKNSIPDLTTRTYKSKSALAAKDIRSLPDGSFVLAEGDGSGTSRFFGFMKGRKEEYGIELQLLMKAMGVEFKFDQASVGSSPSSSPNKEISDIDKWFEENGRTVGESKSQDEDLSNFSRLFEENDAGVQLTWKDLSTPESLQPKTPDVDLSNFESPKPSPQPDPQPQKVTQREPKPFKEPEPAKKLEDATEENDFFAMLERARAAEAERGEIVPREQQRSLEVTEPEDMSNSNTGHFKKFGKGWLMDVPKPEPKAKNEIEQKEADKAKVDELLPLPVKEAIAKQKVKEKVIDPLPNAAPNPRKWDFPFFSRYEEPVIQTFRGNFLPVAPSFYSARVEIPGHIINSGRLDYGD